MCVFRNAGAFTSEAVTEKGRDQKEEIQRKPHGRPSDCLTAMETFLRNGFISRSVYFLQRILFSNDNCIALTVKEEINPVPVTSSFFFMKKIVCRERMEAWSLVDLI